GSFHETTRRESPRLGGPPRSPAHRTYLSTGQSHPHSTATPDATRPAQDQGRKRNNCFTSVWSDARPERHVWGSAWCYLETSPGGSLSNSAAKLLRDRKSTRLNSSHGSISYAVFCLNKKLL